MISWFRIKYQVNIYNQINNRHKKCYNSIVHVEGITLQGVTHGGLLYNSD